MTPQLEQAIAAARALTPHEQIQLLDTISLDMLRSAAPDTPCVREPPADFRAGGERHARRRTSSERRRRLS